MPKSSLGASQKALTADLIKRCTDDHYAWQSAARPSKETFILHDGPPYANGPLHVGHALNKITKDIICRFQVTQGKRVHYVPGWDCHGLPIELKAMTGDASVNSGTDNVKAVPQQGETSKASKASQIRRVAKELAQENVEIQQKGLQEWQIMADWEHRWLTMQPQFEVKQLQVFQKMVTQGLIRRAYRPVWWSPSTQTALAEAELEYDDRHVSQSVYLKIPIRIKNQALRQELGFYLLTLHACVWTTTPWTLPANKAIAVNRDVTYVVLEVLDRKRGSKCHLLVAEARAQDIVNEVLYGKAEVLEFRIKGSDLEGTEYSDIMRHCATSPGEVRGLEDQRMPIRQIMHGAFVSADTGTGIVHMAPGHGMDDYEVCQQEGIDASAPVDDYGRFTEAALPWDPERLKGQEAMTEGAATILWMLRSTPILLRQVGMTHKYPIDWRTKKPIMLRATKQWFADVGSIKQAALGALEDVHFVSETNRARLQKFVEHRSEWCISRQRAWGVPIPVLYDVSTDEPLLTEQSVDHIIRTIEEKGIEAWWTDPPDDPSWFPPSESMAEPRKFIRGSDTMDVWFDSGSSWTMMQQDVNQPALQQADIYLEGTDQHRGWFQSSLLTYVACQQTSTSSSSAPTAKAPFKTLVTHGFVLDQHRKKMSKTVGNVIAPSQIIDGSLALKDADANAKTRAQILAGCGVNLLRLWVASSDFRTDVMVGSQGLRNLARRGKKLRLALKFLLGNVEGFDPRADAVPYAQLRLADRLALLRLAEVQRGFLTHMHALQMHLAWQVLDRYLEADLSAGYLDTVKDRLYCEDARGVSRRAAQTVLACVLQELLTMLGPIMPALVVEARVHTPESIEGATEDPLRRRLGALPVEWDDVELAELRAGLTALDGAVKMLLEVARGKELLGSSLQAEVVVQLQEELEEGHPFGRFCRVFTPDDLQELLVVSRVVIEGPPASSATSSTPSLDSGSDSEDSAAPSSAGSDSPAEPSPSDSQPPEWSISSTDDVPTESQVAKQEPEPSTAFYRVKIGTPSEREDPSHGDASISLLGAKVEVTIRAPSRQKCARCWQYNVEPAAEPTTPDQALCGRCSGVVERLGETAP